MTQDEIHARLTECGSEYKRNRCMIQFERLKELLYYEPTTGIFTWRESRGAAKAGQIASTQNSNGYLRFQLDGRRYYAHRLAWFYVTGIWPKNQIDHKNGMRTDNRLWNLREATNQINAQNKRKPMARNTCGFLGVQHNRNRFSGLIEKDGCRFYLGIYDTPMEAHQAYIEAKRKLHEGNTL